MVQYIKRFNMDFFDGRYRRELGETKRWELQREALQQIEVTLSETSGDGLIDKLDAFWSGWQALAADPSNMVLRADLKERLPEPSPRALTGVPSPCWRCGATRSWQSPSGSRKLTSWPTMSPA